jgi:hypothetical protein
MGLPDRDSVKTWGGKLLVDREGTSIGTCTEIFLDDATGLPEWATADLGGGAAFIPLLDAAESGDHVRVAVRQDDVAQAPSVGGSGHLSPDDEERLYRHYGIEFSRSASESLLPVGDEPVPPEGTLSTSPEATPEAAPEAAPEETQGRHGLQAAKGKGLRALAGSLAGALAVIAVALLWRRRRQPLPATRAEQLAAHARTASLILAAKRQQLATNAAPLVRSGRVASAVAAQQAAVRARAAAEQAAAQAAVQARAARKQAVVLAAAAKAAGLPKVSWKDAADTAPAVPPAAGRQPVRGAVADVLKAAAGFAAGYAVRARTAGSRGDQADDVEQSARTAFQRQQLQEAAGRVRSRVTGGLQAGNAQLTRRAGEVTEKVRRRSSGGSGEAQALNGSEVSGTE